MEVGSKNRESKRELNSRDGMINKKILYIRLIEKVVVTQKLAIVPLFIKISLIIFTEWFVI